MQLAHGALTLTPQAGDRRHLCGQDRQRRNPHRLDAERRRAVHNHIRGLSPFPGAWCEWPGTGAPVRVKILRTTQGADGAARHRPRRPPHHRLRRRRGAYSRVTAARRPPAHARRGLFARHASESRRACCSSSSSTPSKTNPFVFSDLRIGILSLAPRRTRRGRSGVSCDGLGLAHGGR